MYKSNHRAPAMKKRLIFPLLVAMLLTASSLHAQDAPASKPQATAPYKAAFGLRTTFSGPSGIKSELRLKYFINSEAALELQAGEWFYQKAYHASLHYLWQPQLLSSSRFRPYAGIGIGVVGTTRDKFHEQQNLEMGAVLLGSLGVEYTFPRLPLALSLDYRHTLLGLNTDTFRAIRPAGMNTLGFSVKYIIR